MALGFFKTILQKFTGKPVDWDDLEETLIRSDLGVPMTMQILKKLQESQQKLTAEGVVEVAREGDHVEHTRVFVQGLGYGAWVRR
jgi:signal recognition particle GTPase